MHVSKSYLTYLWGKQNKDKTTSLWEIEMSWTLKKKKTWDRIAITKLNIKLVNTLQGNKTISFVLIISIRKEKSSHLINSTKW